MNALMKALSKKQAQSLTTVSQWIDAGGLRTGWSHLTSVVARDTPKAIAINGSKWNASGGSRTNCLVWFPKSQLIPVEDDFYDHKIAGQNYLIPHWLTQAKEAEGFELIAA